MSKVYYLYMIDRNDYECSNPCSYSLKMLIFQNWECLVMLEEKPAKPGTTVRSSFVTDDVSEMELVEIFPILRCCWSL